MSRTLTLLFRRDPSKDREDAQIQFEGYEILWPDGRPVSVGLDAFCKHGQRLLGLGKHLAGCTQKLIKMVCMPLQDREDPITRIPGHRVRRFYILRQGQEGRVFFMDGTPTTIRFHCEQDDQRVLNWLGIPSLQEGEEGWFDLAATEVSTIIPPSAPWRAPVLTA